MLGRHCSPVSAVIALAVMVAVGCGAAGQAAPSPGLSISNGTTLTVTLVVNGTPVGTFAPGTGRDPIPASDLPALPWHVEARSPSGRLLTSMIVDPGNVSATTEPNGDGREKGDGVRVDLSCGRLDIWSGPPMIGLAPGPARPVSALPDAAVTDLWQHALGFFRRLTAVEKNPCPTPASPTPP
jgi:hypothetical protein